MYSTIIQNLVVPMYDLARGTSRWKYGKVLEKTQYLNRDEIIRLQKKNLRALIIYAYRTVPYYHRVFRERGLRPDDIRNVQDLQKLPVLTKADVRKNSQDLISKDYPRSRLIPYETGGTGSPLKFYITRDKISWEVAAEYRAYGWANYKFGDRCFMFWGSHKDLHTNISKKVAGWLQRTVAVDPFVLSDEALDNFSVMLRKFDPEVVRGYATPVYMMAKYLLEKGIEDVRPKTVITGAEILFNPMRKTIEKAFGCQVFDHYGSREIGATASECEEHSGYHITAENVIVEFVRDSEHVSHGEDGAILLTGLRNYGMPFIRYQNGDVGSPSDEACSCGRGLPLMKSIKGRMSQFLAVCDEKSGQIIPLDASVMMEYFMVHLKSPPDSYRVIQESLGYVRIEIVRSKSYSSEDTNFLLEQLRKYLGTSMKIEIRFVDALPPLPSGKRSTIISKIKVFEDISS